MADGDRITIDVFKAVTRAIAESDNLGLMTNHLTQLLAGTLDNKGCTLFAFNPGTRELEVLASFGLSLAYLNKGPIFLDESLEELIEGQPVVFADVTRSAHLQYPRQAAGEGIRAMVTVPIHFCGEFIGALRLYHGEAWEISPRDLDSLILLAENVGLALTYTRLLNAIRSVREVLEELPAAVLPRG
jgi:GAF domain-containing protein